jgi:hypothetical protein
VTRGRVDLGDRDAFELEIAPVAKRIGDATVRMLAYHGSIPARHVARHETRAIYSDARADN